MSPFVGWVLAALALATGWRFYGVQGLALAGTVIAFWLLLQFSRAVRVMRGASGAPVGHVPSAVMLNAKLRAGLQTMEVIRLAGSLGLRAESTLEPATADGAASRGATEVLAWQDDGGAEVRVAFRNGRCASWVLRRPEEAAE